MNKITEYTGELNVKGYLDLRGSAITSLPEGLSVGGGGTILKTYDGGDYWMGIPSGTMNDLYALNTVGNYCWAVGKSGTILKSSDQGSNWSVIPFSYNIDFNSVFFTDQNIGWAVAGGGSIFKTTNGGDDWIRKDDSVYFKNELKDIYFINKDTGWFVGVNKTILKTTDGCESWTTENYQFPPSDITSMRVDFFSIKFIDQDTGWIAGSEGIIIKTTNGGKRWFLSGNMTSNSLSAIDFANSNIGWAVGSNGTIINTMNGGGKDSIPLPPPPPPVESQRPVLFQNFPNPFNSKIETETIDGIPLIGATIIRYLLPNDDHVTIKVYNILGQYVETLINEYQNANMNPDAPYEVYISAFGRPSGVYFYRLSTSKFSEVKRMVLIK